MRSWSCVPVRIKYTDTEVRTLQWDLRRTLFESWKGTKFTWLVPFMVW